MAVNEVRDVAVAEIEKTPGEALDPARHTPIALTIESATINSAERANESHADVMLKFPLVDQDKAHKLADEMDRAHMALISNLAAQR